MNSFTKDILSLATARHLALPLNGPYDLDKPAIEELQRYEINSIRNADAPLMLSEGGSVVSYVHPLEAHWTIDEKMQGKRLRDVVKAEPLDEWMLMEPSMPLEEVLEELREYEVTDFGSVGFLVKQDGEIIGSVDVRSVYGRTFTLYLLACFLDIESKLGDIFNYYPQIQQKIPESFFEEAQQRRASEQQKIKQWNNIDTPLRSEEDNRKFEEFLLEHQSKWQQWEDLMGETFVEDNSPLDKWKGSDRCSLLSYLSFSQKLRVACTLPLLCRNVPTLRSENMEKAIVLRNHLAHGQQDFMFLRDVLPYKEIVMFGIWLLQLEAELTRHADELDAQWGPFQR